MDFIRGRVVRSCAGHDKGSFLVVLRTEENRAVVCDGRRRSLEHPKRKNLRHLSMTSTVLPENLMQTSCGIRRALAPFGRTGPLSR